MSEASGVMNDRNPHPLEASGPSEEREELLTYSLEKEGVKRQTIPKALSDETRLSFPLSVSQERFWFLEQFEPDRSVYNSCKAERLIGPLNRAALEQSLNAVVQRHEALRTKYPDTDGKPSQQIEPALKLSLPLTDLRAFQSAERHVQISRLAVEQSQRPFNLAEGPLIRVNLLRLEDQDHVLLLSVHQIIFDSWSVGVFFQELWLLYEAYSSGQSPHLENLPIQYADFTVWQRQSLRGETLEKLTSYWKQQLGKEPPNLSLPTDHPRQALQSFAGARRPVKSPEGLTVRLKELSRGEENSLFMTLLAAFKTLLHRYTAEEDLVVGCPVVNRSLPEVKNLIGSFVNTLALRTDLSGNPTFRDVLARVRNVCLEAYAHQDLPFEKLIEELHPARDLSRNPVFQVMFAFQNAPVPQLNLPHLKSEPIEIDGGIAKFDLTLSLAENRPGLSGYWEYNIDLFNHSTIERMAGHFQTLLEGIVANPDELISRLPLLSYAECCQLLFEWNDTKADYPSRSCIHELFEAKMARVPEAIAVEFGEQKLTYRELNERANQLAHYLRSLGVGPATLVGICIERSLEMVVGLLGILKAGGAYLPLDPAFPGGRLAFMLEDAQVSVLLTEAKLVEDRGWSMENGDPRSSILDPRLQVVFVDRDWDEIAQQSDKNPLSQVYSTRLSLCHLHFGLDWTTKRCSNLSPIHFELPIRHW